VQRMRQNLTQRCKSLRDHLVRLSLHHIDTKSAQGGGLHHAERYMSSIAPPTMRVCEQSRWRGTWLNIAIDANGSNRERTCFMHMIAPATCYLAA